MESDEKPGPDSQILESAVAGAVAAATADDEVVIVETASQRFSNYCKGIGGLVSGLAAIAAVILSIFALTRGEPTAKKGYFAVDGVVKQLSTDLQREHDGREAADALLVKDVTAVRDQLQLVVRLLSVRSPTSAVRLPRLPRGVLSPASLPVPASQPAALLLDLQSQVKSRPAAAMKKMASPRPPTRRLPPLGP
jgi:hypothetical protein